MAASGAVPAAGRAAPAPWVYDALLAAGVSLILAAFIAADIQETRPPVWAYLWAAGFGALMFIRRSYPTLVVVLSGVGFVAYYASGFTTIGTAVPMAAAVFSAAECGRLTAAIAGSAAVTVISIGYRLASGQEPAFVLGYDLPQNLLILAGAIALGDSLRARRTLQRQAGTIAQLTAERYRLDAQERLAAERLEVSRELHDSIGHSLAVISLHTEVAREAPEEDAKTRNTSLDVIRSTTADAVAELKRTVAGLRSGSPPAAGTHGLDSLDSTLASARAAGLDITLQNGVQSMLPVSVQSTLYRIIQESITNAVRHSAAGKMLVRLQESEGAVSVWITDDGAVPRGLPVPEAAPGFGLAGLRERAEALGGEFGAGWTPSGFRVEASLPLDTP
ncbi:sensor histidine kinase [Arthrobacter sp. NPDC055585]